MQEINFKMVVEKPEKMKGALEIDLNPMGEITVKVNQRFMYRLLASRDIIVSAANKTLYDILEQHLARLAQKEEGL